ncbi:hypothetical protein J6590_003942 [Homalodisca vitripennis]|nr:hypothetical protein J6590_003942 [Homalodisca vitripennis]
MSSRPMINRKRLYRYHRQPVSIFRLVNRIPAGRLQATWRSLIQTQAAVSDSQQQRGNRHFILRSTTARKLTFHTESATLGYWRLVFGCEVEHLVTVNNSAETDTSY